MGYDEETAARRNTERYESLLAEGMIRVDTGGG